LAYTGAYLTSGCFGASKIDTFSPSFIFFGFGAPPNGMILPVAYFLPRASNTSLTSFLVGLSVVSSPSPLTTTVLLINSYDGARYFSSSFFYFNYLAYSYFSLLVFSLNSCLSLFYRASSSILAFSS